jgi:hypothetical protein
VNERIFISYRTGDGADKATALARDLGRVFGDAAVFLDKDDLRGGSRWAQEVGSTLQTRPVLLLLLTPQLLTATDPSGGLRILDAADPVRREVAAALAAGAELIPVLCDGVAALPSGAALPPPFDTLGERTWRRLRAYDWAADVQRLVADLQALGVPPLTPAGTRRPWLALAGLAAAGAVGAGWWLWRRSMAPPGLSGDWQAQVQADTPRLVLQQQGEQLTLESHPIDIRQRADWDAYRRFWRERFGSELEQVRWRGQGTARAAPGSPLAIDVALQIVSVPGDQPVDGGNLSATLSADGRQLRGTRWLNSEQADAPAVLVRIDR